MAHQSGSSHLRGLFDAALQGYEKTTNITLAKHPLAEQIHNCHVVEPTTTFLQEKAQEFGDFRGSDKVKNAIKNIVSTLSVLSSTAILGDVLFPPVKAIQTGLAILLVEAKEVTTSYDALLELLESIDHRLKPLDIYTRAPHTLAMDELVVKIMAELLSGLALTTEELKQGRLKRFVKPYFEEKYVEEVLQRLGRLSQDEARTTAAEILRVVHGLIRDMNGKVSRHGVRTALEMLHQMASEINKPKRDQLQKAIQGWLSAPDPWKNHQIARESRHEATGAWFIKGETFSDWKYSWPSSLLWIYGKPGAGKSVFCSTIIEEIEALRKSGLASLAFFYHDFRDDPKKDHRGLLSSSLVQLCYQSDAYCDKVTEFYLEHGSGSECPSDTALLQCLLDVLKLPGEAQVYLIVDALDECPNTSAVPSPRKNVLKVMEELVDSQLPNLRICVTSRPETDIKRFLDPLVLRSVSLHEERGQIEDIKNYIKSVVNKDPRNRKWKAEDKQLVIDVLTRHAAGMFRWVYCQLEHLWNCHPGRIRHALSELPETLDKTYERTLREINKADWELAHRLFQCVAFASRPLRVEELAEFLAFDFKAGPIAKFQEDWRLEDPVDAVLSRCSALLVLVNVDGSQVIQFSHFSVKEFLTSARLAESTDKTLRRFSISMTPAHTLITQACLGILLHLDTDITRDNLTKYPLAQYSAQHWVNHARFENVSQNVEDGMKELFDPRKRHIATWVWIFDSRNPIGDSERAEWPTPPGGTSLHYAAVCGLDRIVKFLAVEHSQDVNSPHFDDEWSPLHLASGYGHVEVARILIEQGADVTTRTINGRTPLHVASRRGHVDVAGFLVEHGANVIALDNDGNTALHEAAMRGHVDMSRFLLQQGTDATVRNNFGWSPLLNVSTYGYVELARLLIELGADVSAQASDQKSPLHEASVFGHLALVRIFIEHGADMTACYKDGRTPLHFASSYGYLDIVRILVKHGADATAQAANGQSPLHVAASYGHVEIACILVEHGADVKARTEKGWTPLHSAADCGDVQVARFLIERGADVTASGSDAGTPRDLASKKGHVEFVRFLDKHSAHASTQSKDKRTTSPMSSSTACIKTGWNLLHVAAAQGDVEVVRALVECGADTTALADDGRTPLHVAAEAGNVEVVRLLANHGKDTTIARPTQGIRLFYYLVAFCIFVEIYLRFM